jgi:hypothetical protein
MADVPCSTSISSSDKYVCSFHRELHFGKIILIKQWRLNNPWKVVPCTWKQRTQENILEKKERELQDVIEPYEIMVNTSRPVFQRGAPSGIMDPSWTTKSWSWRLRNLSKRREEFPSRRGTKSQHIWTFEVHVLPKSRWILTYLIFRFL